MAIIATTASAAKPSIFLIMLLSSGMLRAATYTHCVSESFVEP